MMKVITFRMTDKQRREIMTLRRARLILAEGDRFTGGGILPWAGMPGWSAASVARYHEAYWRLRMK